MIGVFVTNELIEQENLTSLLLFSSFVWAACIQYKLL